MPLLRLRLGPWRGDVLQKVTVFGVGRDSVKGGGSTALSVMPSCCEISLAVIFRCWDTIIRIAP